MCRIMACWAVFFFLMVFDILLPTVGVQVGFTS